MRDHGAAEPRAGYRPPQAGISAREDYPNAPISIVVNDTVPGAELFAVAVAIGADIPLHHHSMMEYQFVVSGSGLALDADGGETPIAPGGTVLSPAGPPGAHGFRNRGPLPLTLLCIYPSPGGATPDRSPFEPGTDPGAGPRSLYVAPGDLRGASPIHPGPRGARIIDETVPGAELFAELVSVFDEIPMHYHPVFELHYVVAGTGTLVDVAGMETPVSPGGVITSPAGRSGGHGLRRTGNLPLQLMSVFPASGGAAPGHSTI